MKLKKRKKLFLIKMTIANLNKSDLQYIRGGWQPACPNDKNNPYVIASTPVATCE